MTNKIGNLTQKKRVNRKAKGTLGWVRRARRKSTQENIDEFKKRARDRVFGYPSKRRISGLKSSDGTPPDKPNRVIFTGLGGNIPRRRRLNIENSKLKTNEPQIHILDGSIYLDTDESKEIKNIYGALINVLDAIDFKICNEGPSEKGSWFKRFQIKSKEAFNSNEVQERLMKLERAIELKNIDKVQSEVDLNIAKAVSELIDKSKDTPKVCVMLGSLVFVKVTNNGIPTIFAKNLNQRQLKMIQENPGLLKNPNEIYRFLESENEIEKKMVEKQSRKAAGE